MLNQRSKEVRKKAILLSKKNGGYHFGGSFSCAEILINLFDEIMLQNDKFILSKGHGCWIYYVLLMEQGFKPKLEGHPHFDPTNGIFFTTGSMGHGLPGAIGMALAKKKKGDQGRVFVLIGDGETQEGTTWESILIASKLKLDNLIVILDNNKIQGSDFTNSILPIENILSHTAAAANWEVFYIDGHNQEFIKLNYESNSKPKLIIADTVKGKGVSFMEGKPQWHSNWLSDELEKVAMKELS